MEKTHQLLPPHRNARSGSHLSSQISFISSLSAKCVDSTLALSIDLVSWWISQGRGENGCKTPQKWTQWINQSVGEAILQRKFWSCHSPNFHHWKTCKNLVLWLSLIEGCSQVIIYLYFHWQEPGEGGQGDELVWLWSGSGRCLRQFLTVPLTFPLEEEGTVLLTKVIHSVEDDGEWGDGKT